MGLFSDPNEQARKDSLRKLEDKRLALAEKLDKQGFKPETMLFAQSDNGGFVAVCRYNGRQWLIVGPGFGTDEEFIVADSDRFDVRKEEVLVKSEGMGGIMGFGRKGEHGAEYVVTLPDGREVRMPFVFGRNGWGEFPLKKNPLLSTKRRRKDANLVWDLTPIDNAKIQQIMALAEGYLFVTAPPTASQ